MVVYQSLIQKKGEGRQHKAGASAKYLSLCTQVLVCAHTQDKREEPPKEYLT